MIFITTEGKPLSGMQSKTKYEKQLTSRLI